MPEERKRIGTLRDVVRLLTLVSWEHVGEAIKWGVAQDEQIQDSI